MSTSKTDLYLYIRRRSAKEQTSQLFTLGPLTTWKKIYKYIYLKPKRPGKKSREKKGGETTERWRRASQPPKTNAKSIPAMRNPYEEIGGMRRKQLWEETRRAGGRLDQSALRFSWDTRPPKKIRKKENFVAIFAFGEGGWSVTRGKRLVWHFGAIWLVVNK